MIQGQTTWAGGSSPESLDLWCSSALFSLWLTMWLISFWLSSSTLELTTANIIAFPLQPMVWKPVRVIFNVERMQQHIATISKKIQTMNHVNLEDIQPLQLLCFVRSNIYLFFQKLLSFRLLSPKLCGCIYNLVQTRKKQDIHDYLSNIQLVSNLW